MLFRRLPRRLQRIDGENELARDLPRGQTFEHRAGLLEWKRLFNSNPQRAGHDPADHFVDTLAPRVGSKIDMTEMKAGEGQRFRHQPLPQIGKWPALGFAETDDMPEFADCRKAAVENARAGRIDNLVDALAPGESHCSRDEILFLSIDDLRRAELERAFFLAARADRADHGGAGMDGELGCEQADSAPDGVKQDDVPGLGDADIVQEMPGRQSLEREARGDVQAHPVGDGDEPLSGSNALICEASGLLQERGDGVADRKAAHVRPHIGDPPRDFEPADEGISLRMRVSPLRDHGVGEIAAAIGDVDEDLAVAGRWRWRFRYVQIVPAAWRGDYDRTHARHLLRRVEKTPRRVASQRASIKGAPENRTPAQLK